MEKRRRFISFWRPPIYPPNGGERPEELRAIERRMKATFNEALERRETMSHVLAHSKRVARVAVEVGAMIDLEESELELLERAAELHEIGMLAVPASLLTRRSRLTADELFLVRSHAKMGAEIVRATHDDQIATLIEQQYMDYDELSEHATDTRETLLSGILRVADVFDAVTSPRPYQLPLEDEEWRDLLRAESGTKFHPAAVLALFRWAEEASLQ